MTSQRDCSVTNHSRPTLSSIGALLDRTDGLPLWTLLSAALIVGCSDRAAHSFAPQRIASDAGAIDSARTEHADASEPGERGSPEPAAADGGAGSPSDREGNAHTDKPASAGHGGEAASHVAADAGGVAGHSSDEGASAAGGGREPAKTDQHAAGSGDMRGASGSGGVGGSIAGSGGASGVSTTPVTRHCFTHADHAPDAVSTACAAKATKIDSDGSARPPGVGYDDDLEAIPDHVAYLTFDDGPSQWTTDFLDVLKKYGVHATFFLNATRVISDDGVEGDYNDENGNDILYRDVLAKTANAGHVLGNHTVDHEDLLTLAPSEIERQLDDNERLINRALALSGAATRPLSLIRPPYGSPFYPNGQTAYPGNDNSTIGGVLQQRGLNVLWNVTAGDALDLAQGESTSRTVAQTPTEPALTYADKVSRTTSAILDDAHIQDGRGIIILLHDMYPTTRDALPAIIEGLRERNYALETIDDYALSRYGRPAYEVVPGPKLYDPCTPEGDRGCVTMGEGRVPVCGRFWSAYVTADGASRLGSPMSAPAFSTSIKALVQRFDRGSIELHPDADADCDVVVNSP
jgi:peptidoglycan-N-acetylglucosamine deacetylase